ncbi:hypothetical protein AAJCM20276_23760 [Acetobacter aceti]|uniref:Uncharacterized protein n=1 Tax=Acetobacter aceti TaxID=435 RepID=A0A6S6PSQ6_ACEAC|nr:hypothetical protein AAJCM20276_23760 [Acetobacter aceti]
MTPIVPSPEQTEAGASRITGPGEHTPHRPAGPSTFPAMECGLSEISFIVNQIAVFRRTIPDFTRNASLNSDLCY